jgi:cyclophilin family peptidyl-prolyl cis-trans isomerase
MNLIRIIVASCCTFVLMCAASTAQTSAAKKSYGDLLKASSPGDWRPIDNDNTLYLELATGRVVMELAPAFAPNHVANIKALAREGYFDGLVIMRAQENYVVQWGDPTEKKMPVKAKKSLPAEFTVPLKKDMLFTKLPDVDGYAKEVGFANGFHAGRDPKSQQMWLTHCYATLGVGRDNDVNSGGGTELYVVIGHAPRHLDRNITLVGRVIQGMPLLTTLPRGTGQLGFYEKDEQRVPIKSMRVAADVPAAERSNLEIIRTDTQMFKDLIEALRNRSGDWYKVPAGHIELCNVPIAVRDKASAK